MPALGCEVGRDEEVLWRAALDRSHLSSSAPVLPKAEGHGEGEQLIRTIAGASEWVPSQQSSGRKRFPSIWSVRASVSLPENGDDNKSMHWFPRVTNTTNWVTLNTEIYFLTFLEARHPKHKCQQGHAPSEGTREESFLASSSFWWLSVTLSSFVCGSIFLISASISTCSSSLCVSPSSYKNTSHWIRAHPNPVWLHHNLITSYKDPISK